MIALDGAATTSRNERGGRITVFEHTSVVSCWTVNLNRFRPAPILALLPHWTSPEADSMKVSANAGCEQPANMPEIRLVICSDLRSASEGRQRVFRRGSEWASFGVPQMILAAIL